MNKTPADAREMKDDLRRQWDAAAAGWDAHTPQVRAWLRQATDAMIAMAGVRPGATVIDVAAGAGDQSLDLAACVGPQGRVLATDLSPALAERAGERARAAGVAQMHVQVADGEALPVESGSFDAAVCRLGLMLFPDPLQGLREMHRALRPGGGIATVVFSSPDRNPCVRILMSSALRHAGLAPGDPFQPGSLFSLGRPGHIDALFRQAGFREVATTAMPAVFRMPSVDAYLAFVRSSASPIVQLLARLEDAAADAAWADIRAQLQVFDTADGWQGPNELLITAARKP